MRALDLIATSLCQAVFDDLEKSTGVNVWTFAQNIAGGWFERFARSCGDGRLRGEFAAVPRCAVTRSMRRASRRCASRRALSSSP